MPKSEFKNPALTVDGLILFENGDLALIQRGNEPFKGQYALPGGFVDYGESVEHALIREMKEETNMNIKPRRLIGVYSDPYRDPRGHTVSVAFECKIISEADKYKAGDDAKKVIKVPIDTIGTIKLAFDHNKIVSDYLKIIKYKKKRSQKKKTAKRSKKTRKK